jgi:flavin reductase (DIM6/NTAB) family NADH-FMN oxidoreductase RutF
MNDAERDRIARVLGRIPSGVFVLTARSAAGRTAMLASWVQQAGFDPPTVSVAVRKGRPIETLIDESRRFALNVVGADPTAMFRHFGRGFTLDQDPFAGLDARNVEGGVAIGGVGLLACRVRNKFDAGDHWLYVGEVIRAEGDEDGAPYVHLRRNGLGY